MLARRLDGVPVVVGSERVAVAARAVELGADLLVTACPFCLITLEDAVKTSGSEGKIEVVDLAELVSMAL